MDDVLRRQRIEGVVDTLLIPLVRGVLVRKLDQATEFALEEWSRGRVALSVRIAELTVEHGGLNAAARAVGVDAAYLLRLSNGAKLAPSDAVLEKLGLRRIVQYERVP